MPHFYHNEHKLFYRQAGRGPVLLILPGNTATSACHSSELDYFGQTYHTVSLDFWGTGQSDHFFPWPDDWWEQSVHDAVALIKHLGASQALVMGTSGGAIVALLTAILYPTLVRGVVADSVVEHFPAPFLSDEIKERARRTKDQISFWSWANGVDWEDVVDADSDFLLRFEQAGGDCFQGRLKEICCPVLLSASLGDTSLPDGESQIRRMAQQIPYSQLFFTTTGSHPMMWSRPDDFRPAASCFLANLVG